MKNVLKWLQVAEKALVVVTFSGMVIASFIQVVNRNVFQIPVVGLDEAARYCMVYMVMLGTELGLRDGTQISVTGAVDKLKGRAGKAVHILAKLVLVAFSAVMVRVTWGMVQKQSFQLSPGLQVPMSVPYFAMLLGFAIICLVQLVTMIKMIRDINKPDGAVEGGEVQ